MTANLSLQLGLPSWPSGLRSARRSVRVPEFHRKDRRTKGLMVRRAVGAQRGIGPGGGSANPHSRLLCLLPFCPSCEKISLARGDLPPPRQPLRFELQFGSQEVMNPERFRAYSGDDEGAP